MSDVGPVAHGDGGSESPLPDAPIDGRAVLRGAVIGAAIALPAAIVQNIASDDSSVRGLMLAAILLALGYSGAVAARAAGDRILVHGVLGALGAFAIVQVIAMVVRVARGAAVHPVSIIFTGLLAASCGLIGAELGSRRQQRRAAAGDDDADTKGDRS